jgi:hypothetical protein
MVTFSTLEGERGLVAPQCLGLWRVHSAVTTVCSYTCEDGEQRLPSVFKRNSSYPAAWEFSRVSVYNFVFDLHSLICVPKLLAWEEFSYL